MLTNTYKADMVAYLKSHPEDFEEVVQLALGTRQPYSWRAAWLLWSCMKINDQRIQGHIEKIIDILPIIGDEQLRELLIILQKMELPQNYRGILFDNCVNVWEKKGKKPSVRYNAFKLMVKIARKYPELNKEVRLLTESHYVDTLSNVVKKSILKMAAEL